MTYELDVFFSIPLTAMPDKVRVFAGTLTVTPTHKHLTWYDDDTEHSRTFPEDTLDDNVFDWVYAKLTAD